MKRLGWSIAVDAAPWIAIFTPDGHPRTCASSTGNPRSKTPPQPRKPQPFEHHEYKSTFSTHNYHPHAGL